MPEPDSRLEARRQLTLCNVCDYCSGYCETFVAAGRRRAFTDGDLTTLANLCHNCRACFHACQYAPPHAFAINVPKVLAELRQQSYRELAWPRPRAGARWAALPMAVAAPLLAVLILPGDVLFVPHRGPGAFYEVTPLPLLVATAGLIGAWSMLALMIALVRFWRKTGGGAPKAMLRAIPGALSDILSLRNLDGGGHGCNDLDDSFSKMRRWLHHAVFYGFLCCLASTAAAHAAHHFLGRLAPYPLTSPPVLLGAIGGGGIVVGCVGLASIKALADPRPTAPTTQADGAALLASLFVVAASGLALLALRETPAMGLLLTMHLGATFGFLASLPYGKFTHGPFRAAALLRAVMERQTPPAPPPADE
jgi:citrate/tricarballylate utilization protein